MVEEVRKCVQLRGKAGPEIEAGVSTAFGCTMQGVVPEDDVVRLAVMLVDAGVDCVALGDTVGYANPAQIRSFSKGEGRIGASSKAAHLHDTRGLGLANALAAYEEACAISTARWAAWAAAPSRPARAATSSPRTWSSCSRAWARRRA